MIFLLSWMMFFLAEIVTNVALAAKTETTVRLGYDDFCPYSCLNANEKGYFVDAVEEILKSSGMKIEPVIGSWARLKTMAQKGDLELVVAVTRFESEELGLARNAFPLGRIDGVLFTHKTSVWRYKNEDSLKGQSIALVRDYSYPPAITRLMDDPKQKAHIITLASDQGTELQVKMLASQRVAVIPSDRNAFLFHARRLGLESMVRVAGELPMEPLYTDLHIGISARAPELRLKLRELLDNGIGMLRKSGWLDRVKAKYGMK